MKVSSPAAIAVALCVAGFAGCSHHEEKHEATHKVVVTSPVIRDVVLTQQYVCQIRSCRHIEVCALQDGYLEEIPVKEGQAVKKGDTMFRIMPVLYQAKLDAEVAEADLAQIEYDNTQRLFQKNVVSPSEVALAKARLAKANAKVALARADLNFATIKAPFDGIIDHQIRQHGSLVAEGDELTTLSDNSVMWVYFNVPESRYLEYKSNQHNEDLKVELLLANGQKFSEIGKIGAIEADFNNETGNIAFRADFPNPGALLRHGQTGTVLLSRVVKDAVVIPQRATYEILAKKYVYIVGDPGSHSEHEEHGQEHGGKHAANPAMATLVSHEHGAEGPGQHPAEEHGSGEHGAAEHGQGPQAHGVALQREIVIANELEDIYVIKHGIKPGDKIVLEGIREARDGEKLKYDFLAPEKALSNLKYHAE